MGRLEPVSGRAGGFVGPGWLRDSEEQRNPHFCHLGISRTLLAPIPRDPGLDLLGPGN